MKLQPGQGRKAALWGGAGVIVAGLALWVSACSRNNPPLSIGKASEEPNAETRDFDISVDGKKAGHYRMEITRPDPHTLVMSGQAEVRVSYLIYTYTYKYQGKETYRNNRLVTLKSTANDNGKRFQVDARAEGDRLLVAVNGKERDRPADVWTTSYWRLPTEAAAEDIALLEPDTGKKMTGRLRLVNKVKLPVAGQELECRHFRLTGTPSPVDLWYDAEQRLVRQDYLDDGHRTVLELKAITRGKAE